MLRTSKKTAAALGTLVLACGLAATSPAAAAPVAPVSNTSLSAEEVEEVQALLNEAAVEQDAQAGLIAKLQAGEPWDSMTDASAVSTSTAEADGIWSERKVYADGSVRISEREIPTEISEESVTPFGVSDCTMAGIAGETQYNNCWASESVILLSAGFDVSYIVGTKNGGRAVISNTGHSTVTVFFGNYSDKTLSILQQEAYTGSPAKAELNFHFQAGLVNSDGRLQFHLTKAGAAGTSAWF